MLAVTRINLAHSEQALSASLISAYKSPMPDPLQAALSARNFGEVLEQFALLDRTNSYNANMLRAIRVYKGEIVRRQRLLARERTRAAGDRRRAAIRCARASAAPWPPRSGATPGCAHEVRRLLDERRQRRARGVAARRRAGAGAARGRGARSRSTTSAA